MGDDIEEVKENAEGALLRLNKSTATSLGSSTSSDDDLVHIGDDDDGDPHVGPLECHCRVW